MEPTGRITGVTINPVMTLDTNRIRQISQYASEPNLFRMMKAASRNELKKGARKPAQAKKTQVVSSESNLIGPGTNNRSAPAPIRASEELLMNQQHAIRKGTPCGSSTARCAGNAASRNIHQVRTGASRRAAISIELGGHITE